ncbi:unnamed protein product [Gordionus sp. m RMFG-2023]
MPDIQSKYIPTDIEILEVIKLLHIVSEKDSNYHDLSHQLKIHNYSHPSVSGLSDLDYPSQAKDEYSFLHISPLTNLKINLLPPEILESINRVGVNLRIGLFTELSRAYFIIDNSFYLWNYENNSDIISYDGFNEIITNAILIIPKIEYYNIDIRYILCLISINNIVLLAIKFGNQNISTYSIEDMDFESIFILPKPLLSLSTDGLIFNQIISLKTNGRIFMAGQDGCLYELYYQLHKNWLGKRAWLINHSRGKLSSFILPNIRNIFTNPDPLVQITVDENRNNLYVLSERGDIQLFYLGLDGNEASHIITINHEETHNRAIAITKLVERDNFGKIVSIAPISVTQSKILHLIAFTSTGFRYYFSTRSYDTEPDTCPFMLKLIHLRFPPSYSNPTPSNMYQPSTLNPTATSSFINYNSFNPSKGINKRPNNVFSALLSKSTNLMVSSPNEISDLLWICNNDNFPFRQHLMESQSNISIDGKMWCLQKVKLPYYEFKAFSLNRPFIRRSPKPTRQHQTIQDSANVINQACQNFTSAFQRKLKIRLFNENSPFNDESFQYSCKTNPPRAYQEIYRDPKRFVCITSQKVFSFEIADPTDFLKALLTINNGTVNCQQILSYVQNLSLTMHGNYDYSLALVNCLHLLCTTGPGEQQILEWTLQFLNTYNILQNATHPNASAKKENKIKDFFSSTPHTTPKFVDKKNISDVSYLGGVPKTFQNGRTYVGENYSDYRNKDLYPKPLSEYESPNKKFRYAENLNNSNTNFFPSSRHGVNFRNVVEPLMQYPLPITPIQEAVFRYFWRIVRPVWNSPICISLIDTIALIGLTQEQAKTSKLLVPFTNYESSNDLNPNLNSNPNTSFKIIFPLFTTADFTVLAERLDGLLKFCETYKAQFLTDLLNEAGSQVGIDEKNDTNFGKSFSIHQDASFNKQMDISPVAAYQSSPFNSSNFQKDSNKRKNVSAFSLSTNTYYTPEKDSRRYSLVKQTFCDTLLYLIRRAKELAILWKLLSDFSHDNMLTKVLSNLPTEESGELLASTFSSMLISHQSISLYPVPIDNLPFHSRQTDFSNQQIIRPRSQLLNRVISSFLNYAYNLNKKNESNNENFYEDEFDGGSNKECDILVKRLQQSCPSFYGPDQASISKANEYLIAASTEAGLGRANKEQKLWFLKESLRLYCRVDPKQLNLSDVCNQYLNLDFYKGILELCLAYANNFRKPSTEQTKLNSIVSKDYQFYYEIYSGLPPSLHNTTSPLTSQNFPPDFEERLKSYTIILNSLKQLLTTASQHSPIKQQHQQRLQFNPNQNNFVTFVNDNTNNADYNTSFGYESAEMNLVDDSEIFLRDTELWRQGDKSSLYNRMRIKLLALLNRCSKSEDELFSYLFFDWLIQNKLTDYLIKSKSNFLGAYFDNVTDRGGPGSFKNPTEVTEMLKLKWKYQQAQKRYLKAAYVLNTLAERVETSITTDNQGNKMRLSDGAVPNRDLSMTNEKKEEWLQELQDKIDVAQIQQKIMDSILAKYGENNEFAVRAINQLNEQLYDLTQLYQDFGEKFKLWDCQLIIMQAANHRDKDLIKETWTQILDELYGSLPNYNNIGMLLDKVYTIGKRFECIAANDNGLISYQQSFPFFPTKFLIRYLENKSFEWRTPSTAIAQTFIKLGYNAEKILRLYIDLYDKNIQNTPFNFHLAHVILLLISHIFVSRENLTINNSQNILNQSLNFTASLVINLQSKDIGRDQKIYELLSKVQAQLSRE